MNSLPQWAQIFLTACAGSAVGTVVKALLRPEPHFGRWLAQLIASFLIGGVVGSAAIEYLKLDPFVGGMAAAAAALIAEEIVRGLQARGRRIREGHFDLSIKGDESDER